MLTTDEKTKIMDLVDEVCNREVDRHDAEGMMIWRSPAGIHISLTHPLDLEPDPEDEEVESDG